MKRNLGKFRFVDYKNNPQTGMYALWKRFYRLLKFQEFRVIHYNI